MASSLAAAQIDSSASHYITTESVSSSLDETVATVSSSSFSSSSFSVASRSSSSLTITIPPNFYTQQISQVQDSQSAIREFKVVVNLFLSEGTYEGEVNSRGQPQGKGILEYSKNDPKKRKTYEGDFEGGKPHGRGMLEWQNGDSYNGQFVEGRREGSGRLIKKVEENKLQVGGTLIFEGQFDHDCFHGKGELRGEFLDGDATYAKGEFRKGELVRGVWVRTYRARDGIHISRVFFPH